MDSMSGSIRGGRRERKKRATRQAIFDAAMALAGRADFEAITVAEICREADVARGTFFLHFPSKAALLAEHERQLAEELSRELAPAPDGSGGSVAGEYRMLADGLVRHWSGRPGLVRALLPSLLAGQGPLPALVEQVVRAGQARGDLRRGMPASFAARAFLATCAAALAAPDGAGDAELRGRILQAALSGLREPKPRLKWKPSAAEQAGR